jgi:glyoxylase-like metal-dependent hydrolase (beta-lactamase superfamily II)
MELVEITRNVYACLQEDRGLGCSNSGLVNRAGGLVVDTFWDLPHTREMIEHYGRVWKGAPRRVVNTHHNGDHCWGNQLFPEAEIIGHRLCAAGMVKESPAMMQATRNAADSADPAIAALARGLAEFDFTGVEITPPTTLFDDRLDLDLEGTRAELIYVGPAHTQGDVIVHLPGERVIFTGDVLFRLCTPVGWEGTYERWIEALDAIVALDPEVIVPGHGPVCGTEGPREMKAYLEYVRAESARYFSAASRGTLRRMPWRSSAVCTRWQRSSAAGPEAELHGPSSPPAPDMNSKERIDCAVALEPPDRVPVGPLLDHFAAAYTGTTMSEFMHDADARISAVLETMRRLGPWDLCYAAETATPALLKLGIPARALFPGAELAERSRS